jgi:hypothetical protein
VQAACMQGRAVGQNFSSQPLTPRCQIPSTTSHMTTASSPCQQHPCPCLGHSLGCQGAGCLHAGQGCGAKLFKPTSHSRVSNAFLYITYDHCQQPMPTAPLPMPWAQPWAWVLGCRQLACRQGCGAKLFKPTSHSRVSNAFLYITYDHCQQPMPTAPLPMPWAQPWAWVLGCRQPACWAGLWGKTFQANLPLQGVKCLPLHHI